MNSGSDMISQDDLNMTNTILYLGKIIIFIFFFYFGVSHWIFICFTWLWYCYQTCSFIKYTSSFINIFYWLFCCRRRFLNIWVNYTMSSILTMSKLTLRLLALRCRSCGLGGIFGGFSWDKDATKAEASDIDLKIWYLFIVYCFYLPYRRTTNLWIGWFVEC